MFVLATTADQSVGFALEVTPEVRANLEQHHSRLSAIQDGHLLGFVLNGYNLRAGHASNIRAVLGALFDGNYPSWPAKDIQDWIEEDLEYDGADCDVRFTAEGILFTVMDEDGCTYTSNLVPHEAWRKEL